MYIGLTIMRTQNTKRSEVEKSNWSYSRAFKGYVIPFITGNLFRLYKCVCDSTLGKIRSAIFKHRHVNTVCVSR